MRNRWCIIVPLFLLISEVPSTAADLRILSMHRVHVPNGTSYGDLAQVAGFTTYSSRDPAPTGADRCDTTSFGLLIAGTEMTLTYRELFERLAEHATYRLASVRQCLALYRGADPQAGELSAIELSLVPASVPRPPEYVPVFYTFWTVPGESPVNRKMVSQVCEWDDVIPVGTQIALVRRFPDLRLP